MKILQVSHGLPPKENAGVELYTYYLSKALIHLGHDVSILCREENPAKEEFSSFHEDVNGLRVTRVVNNLTKISDPRVYYDNHFFDKTFLGTLNQEKPDLIHFQHFIALSANLLKISKEEGYPVVLTLHDFFALCHRIHLFKEDYRLCPGPLYGLECASCLGFSLHPRDIRTKFLLTVKNRLPFPVMKWTKRFLIPTRYLSDRGYEVFHRYRYIHEILKSADLLLVPSRFVQDVFLKYYPFTRAKMMVLPLGIPPIKMDGVPRTPIRSAEGKIRFCYFGNILPIKGLHILIEAFKGLPQGRAALTVYGGRTSWNEAYYDGLRQQALGLSVEFRDPFQRDHLSEALKDQDVVVLPSICYESFSFVIREANHLGYPVIGSRIGAIPEAVEEGVNGLLFEPGNVEGLGRCMMRFIQEPRLIQQMAVHRAGVRSMEEHAFELSDIYQKVVEKRR
jgi:glycosyltransferase involved in cell wall biosynthesis